MYNVRLNIFQLKLFKHFLGHVRNYPVSVFTWIYNLYYVHVCVYAYSDQLSGWTPIHNLDISQSSERSYNLYQNNKH